MARNSLFKTKNIDSLMAQTEEKGHKLKRALGAFDLTLLGIGGIIGTGIFVLTGVGAALHAGPAITLSFVISGLACVFAALCYAEFASMIPVAGSAYTYSYATLGELFAWIIGWDLILEYAVSSITVAIGWSGYFVNLLRGVGIVIPEWACTPPLNIPAALITALMTTLLVIGFGSSSRLAAAYGIAVTLTMTVTTILAYVVARQVWGWSRKVAALVGCVFLAVDAAFLGANLLKVRDGGWVPLVIAAAIYALMSTWKQGRRLLAARLTERAYPLDRFLERMAEEKPIRVAGTAVFMTGNPASVPHPLLHNLEHNKVVHGQVVLLTVTTAEVPHITRAERAQVQRLADNMYRVTLTYGFMDDPDVPKALQRLPKDHPLRIDLSETTFFLGLETLLSTARPGMSRWREKLFAYMSRNARRATAFFRIPPDRVVEIGMHVEL